MKVVKFSVDYVDGPRYYRAGETARVRDVLAEYLLKARIAFDGSFVEEPPPVGKVVVRFNYSRRLNGSAYQAGDVAAIHRDLTFEWLARYGIVTEVANDKPVANPAPEAPNSNDDEDLDDDAEDQDAAEPEPATVGELSPEPRRGRGRPRKILGV